MINIKRFFRQNKLSKSLVSVDIHSHLLPAIDDGAKDIENSLKLINILKDLGYSKLIITPHISTRFPNTKSSIKKSFEFLKNTLNKSNINIEIEYAAEYCLDSIFYELFKKNDFLTFSEKYLLVELPHIFKSTNIIEIFYDILEKGYTIVLAHPERYLYYHNDIDFFYTLKEMGILLQINLNSINGYYSKDVQKFVNKLIEMGLVDIVGTDTHHMKHINNLKKIISSKDYKNIFEKNVIINNIFL